MADNVSVRDASGVSQTMATVDSSGVHYPVQRALLYDASGTALLLADDAAFTVGTSPVAPIGMLADETSPDSVDEGDVGIPRMTLSRIPWAALRGKSSASADTEIAVNASGYVYAAPASNAGSFGDTESNAPRWPLMADGQNWKQTLAYEMQYNPDTTYWERRRGNHAVTLLASAARSSDAASSDQTNHNARTHIVQIIYATSTGAAVTPTLQIKDSISGSYMTVWTAASAISSTGHYAYQIDTGSTASAASFTEAANIRLTRTWRLNCTQSSSGATTYSASADALV